MRRAALISCVILILLCSTGVCVEPGGKPTETTPESGVIQSRDEGGPLPFPEQVIVGDVKTSDAKPIPGVAIKLFADGRLVEIGHTTSAGSYEMKLPLSVERDESVVMWFVDSSGSFLPQCIILKKSSGARNINLFSDCLIEVRMRPQMRVDATLLTESEFVASLKTRDCL